MDSGSGTGDILKLGDIGAVGELTDLIPIGTGSLLGLNVLLGFNKAVGVGGASLSSFFDAFGLEAALLMSTWLILLFQMARWLYTSFYSSSGRPWSPFIFVIILIAVQMIHDLIFYFASLQTTPSKKNEIIDSLKLYAQENGQRGLLNHSLLMLVTAVLAMVFCEQTLLTNSMAALIALYALPYLLTQAGPKPAPPPAPPKKEGQGQQQQQVPRNAVGGMANWGSGMANWGSGMAGYY